MSQSQRASERYFEEQGRISEQEARDIQEARHAGGVPEEPLGPCPYCGIEGDVVTKVDGLGGTRLRCRNCGYSPDWKYPGATLKQSRATWRALSQAIHAAGPDDVRMLWRTIDAMRDRWGQEAHQAILELVGDDKGVDLLL